MAVRFEQLMRGGRAYLRENAARPGAPADIRLKPVKVHSVERGAAYVEVLDTGNRFVTKFANLEPDLEYMRAQLEKVNARRTAPSNDAQALEPAPAPAWPPRLGEVAVVQIRAPEPAPAETAPAPVLEAEPAWLEGLTKLETAPTEIEVASPPAKETDQIMTEKENSKRPRRKFTPEQVAGGVQDILSGMSRKALLEKWAIHSVTYTNWKKQAEAERARQRARERAEARRGLQVTQWHGSDASAGINGTDRQVLEQRPAQAKQLEEDNERLKGVIKMLIEKRPYTVADMEAQSRALMKAIGALLEVG